jgi:tetratricopeptide (TPR) repeat protein
MSEYDKKFKEIMSSQAFDRLEEFCNPLVWTALSAAETNQLASLFVLRAEAEVARGDESAAADSFLLAAQLDPRGIAKTLYLRAMKAISETHFTGYASLACQVFEISLDKYPDCFDSWYLWAILLTHLGRFCADPQYFQQANERFQIALTFRPPIENQAIDNQQFYWQWGLCDASNGELYGEAQDFMKALQKYSKAAEEGVKSAIFFVDYGNAAQHLGLLVSRSDLLREAVQWYQKAIDQLPTSQHAWRQYAFAQKLLYDFESQNEDLISGHDAFKRAVEFDSTNYEIWHWWGKMLLTAGRINHDVDFVKQSVEKFEKAYELDNQVPQILIAWADALVLLGANYERLDFLRDAESKIIIALEAVPNRAEWWYVYGNCLMEMGRYFRDLDYYHRAAAQFNEGLTHDENAAFLWFGLGTANFAVGEQEEDVEMLEKAAICYEKVFEINQGKEHTCLNVWNEWGMALMKIAELTDNTAAVEQAIQKFELAIHFQMSEDDANQVDPDWLYNYGCALDLLGELTDDAQSYEKAVQVLTKVVLLDPKYGFARYNLALALSHLGEAASDVDCFQKSLELFHNIISNDSEDDVAWHEWGHALLHFAELLEEPIHSDYTQKLFEQAESKFQHAIALGNQHAYYSMASLYSLSGNYLFAMHFLEKAEASGTLPSLETLNRDRWLEGLRQQPPFRQFIEYIQKKR